MNQQTPDFKNKREFFVQKERPDGSLWSVAFFINGREQFASRKFFPTEGEARACGEKGIEVA